VFLVRYELGFYIRFGVVTAVTMKNTVFLDVAPCGSYKSHTAEHAGRRHSSWFYITRDGILLGFISQKTEFFIVTAVKTSNLT
jgi:hypothetical protein